MTLFLAAGLLLLLGQAAPLPSAEPSEGLGQAPALTPSEDESQPGAAKAPEPSPARTRVAELLATRDASVMPELLALLDTVDDAVQKDVVMGLIRTFPDLAFNTFATLARDPRPALRRAAARGFGNVESDGSLPILLVLLRDPDEGVRQAAVYGLGRPALEGSNAARRMAAGESSELSPHVLADINRYASAVLGEVLSPVPPPGDEALVLLGQYADYGVARALVEDYARRERTSEGSAAALLDRIQLANRFWLGRPVLPDFRDASLSLEVANLAQGLTRTHEIRVTPDSMRLLRRRGDRQERAMRLLLPLDDLVVVPQLHSPLAERGQGGHALIRYRPQPREHVVGFGASGSYVWLARLPVKEAVVTIERKRAIPLSEELFDASGALLARITYGAWERAAPGAWVPLHLTIDVPAVNIADVVRHVRFDLDLQFMAGLWTLKQGKAVELQGNGEVVRASSHVTNLSVNPATAAPGGPALRRGPDGG